MSENFINLIAVVRRVTAVTKPENVCELEKQIDALMSTYNGLHCSVHSLSTSTPHLLECISTLVGLLGNQNIPLLTILKILSVLHTFSLNELLCKHLVSQLNVLSVLSRMLQKPMGGDMFMKECLRFTQNLTYGLAVSCPNGYVEDIIKFAMHVIHSSQNTSELYLLSLQVLANLCQSNVPVQAFMKGLPAIVEVQRKLLSNLSGGSVTIIIVSLQVLASLYLGEELGEKIFSTSNIEQTFQLAFSVLCTTYGNPSSTRHAVDLLVHILSNHRIQQALERYPSLDRCLEKTVELIPKCDGDTVTKVLELCVCFAHIPGVQSCLVKLLLSSIQTKGENSWSSPGNRTTTSESQSSPFLSVLDWACQSANVHSAATMVALDLLKGIFEVVLDAGLTSYCTECADVMLPMLVTLLEPPNYSGSMETISTSLAKIYKALSVLSVLWSMESYVNLLSEHVHSGILNKLIQDQLGNNHIASGLTASCSSWSATGVSVLMLVLELCLKHRRHSQAIRALLQQHLQDHRLHAVLAYILLCRERPLVLVALQLIEVAIQTTKLQIISLADAIAALSEQRKVAQVPDVHASQYSPCLSKQSSCVVQASEVHSSTAGTLKATLKPVISSSTVDSLIEKFKSGLELKDLKSSEIIEIYEHKVEAMASKESHLQDLVDAKALALAQADRLIHQYRRGKAESDTECLKLRSLIQDAEKRCEILREEIYQRTAREQNLTVKVKSLQAENVHLLQVAEEHRHLTHSFQEQLTRLEQVQEDLQVKQWELKNLDAKHTDLTHQNENLKSQVDKSFIRIKQMEDEVERSEKQCHAMETANQGLQQAVEQSHQRIKSLEKTKGLLEERLGKLSSDVKASEQQNSILQNEILSLGEESKALKKKMKLLEDKLCATEAENEHLQEEVRLFSAVKSLISKSNSKD